MERIDKFVAVMFPYPSGNGLHMGHYYNYAIMDSYCNWLRFLGNKVFQPIGYDAFGLPAENYAKKMNRDPRDVTYENIDNFRKQIKYMNTHYEEMLITSDPEYVAVTQNIFMKLVEADLAYKKFADVDYCPSCETVLAKEQTIEKLGIGGFDFGKVCERCKTPTEVKSLNQWFFRTTNYTQRLIDGLDALDWPESTKEQQRHWMEDGKHRDWCVSRQRNWGCPIPIDGETDTLDTFVDSSFYTIAYCILKGIIARPVDLYVGGSEHACMHLIYARFMTMALHDLGIIDFEEPFTKLIHQGMILKRTEKKMGSVIEKMSKSVGNVISPDDYDPDVLRFYLMFLGHYFDGGVFDDSNINGIKRFFGRWKTLMEKTGNDTVDVESFKKLIFGYTESFKFNKVVSSFMEFYNTNKGKSFNQETKVELNKLLLIYAPNLGLQTEIKTIPVNIWDDYWEDDYIPEGEKQETYIYIEDSVLSHEKRKECLEILLDRINKIPNLDSVSFELKFYDSKEKYPDIPEDYHNFHFKRWEIRVENLTHKLKYKLESELNEANLKCDGLPFIIYSES